MAKKRAAAAKPAKKEDVGESMAKKKFFEKNEGPVDRVIRIILGLVFLYLGYSMSGAWSIIFYVLAVIGLVTGAFGFCSIYRMFNISTK